MAGTTNGENDRRKEIESKARKLLDSMDVVRARSKTWKDEKDIHDEEILKSLDELKAAIDELREAVVKDEEE